ncbi:epsilonTrypsin [Carabus blaptoides fortunei]
MEKFLVILSLSSVAWCQVATNLGGKIVGGEEVDIDRYNYHVSVRVNDRHWCGGAVLNENTILTASHCIGTNEAKDFTVRVGSALHDKGISHGVDRIIKHPSYNPMNQAYDLAILKLSWPISFYARVQPVKIQPEGEEVPAGTPAKVSGWGYIFEEADFLTDKLRAVDVYTVSNAECRKYFNQLTVDMLCAYGTQKDACQGDSGGPLVANNRLIGIVSWGSGCGRDTPGVYSKVSAAYHWITSNM